MRVNRASKVGFALGVVTGCIISLSAYNQLSNATKALLEKGRSKINTIGLILSTNNNSTSSVEKSDVLPLEKSDDKFEAIEPVTTIIKKSLSRIHLNTKVDRRPARLPPEWLKAGDCKDDTFEDDTNAAGILSATGMVHEERRGDTLLGECSCPLRDKPADWNFECADYDWRILR